MYFAFLLAIAISIYYLSSYNEEDDEKTFYVKLFWTLVVSLIFLIYVVNSIFPHSFNNLKWAWYQEYKTWKISTVSATYLYHTEYLKILFYTNIDQDKKEEFLKEYINDDIQKAVTWIEKMDINIISSILTQLVKENPTFSKSALKSLNNIYKNISDPTDEYKNKLWIYRIWTFLK